jgi:anti-sigma regulatory factor (Ser/Thr protein kinase)
MNAAEKDFEVELPPDPTAPEQARRHLEKVARTLSTEVLDDVKLLVNELVTNSVKFAGKGRIGLRLSADPDSVRVEVHDDGPGFSPTNREPSLQDTSGRGLFLVEALADRWGVTLDGTTCVWFEIDDSEGAA